MEKTIEYSEQLNQKIRYLGLALFGCLLIILGSMIKIPWYPIPFTLQTLSIYILGLTQSPKQAISSVACYLFCATLGLPVLCGHPNALWILGKTGGYLVAFPIAAYMIAKMHRKTGPMSALLCGMGIILVLGFFWLIPLIGFQLAFTKGLLVFIPSEMLKIFITIGIAKLIRE